MYNRNFGQTIIHEVRNIDELMDPPLPRPVPQPIKFSARMCLTAISNHVSYLWSPLPNVDGNVGTTPVRKPSFKAIHISNTKSVNSYIND